MGAPIMWGEEAGSKSVLKGQVPLSRRWQVEVSGKARPRALVEAGGKVGGRPCREGPLPVTRTNAVDCIARVGILPQIALGGK